MREPLAVHLDCITVKLVTNHKLKIWVGILWVLDGLCIEGHIHSKNSRMNRYKVVHVHITYS